VVSQIVRWRQTPQSVCQPCLAIANFEQAWCLRQPLLSSPFQHRCKRVASSCHCGLLWCEGLDFDPKDKCRPRSVHSGCFPDHRQPSVSKRRKFASQGCKVVRVCSGLTFSHDTARIGCLGFVPHSKGRAKGSTSCRSRNNTTGQRAGHSMQCGRSSWLVCA